MAIKKQSNPKASTPPLQPLRLPMGWAIIWNTFHEIEARFKSWDDTSWNFSEDMFHAENKFRGVVIDLGWIPEFRANGRFVLRAVRRAAGGEHYNWDRPSRTMTTRSKRKVVDTLEAWLEWYANRPLPKHRKRRV
jgi:hypothetical protein